MIYLGDDKIGKLYLGGTEIGKAYMGSDLVFQKGGGTTPPTPVNLAGNIQNWYYHKGSTNSIAQWDERGYGVLRCSTDADVSNYQVWTADNATTLWSSVNGKTILIRVKASSITTTAIFSIGIYQNSSITSLGSEYARRAALLNWTLAEDGYYEQTFVCDISNFTYGSLTPGVDATFGLNCYSLSKTTYQQIWDAQIYKV